MKLRTIQRKNTSKRTTVQKAPKDTTTAKQREILDTIGEELGIKKQEDWYSVSKQAISKQGGKHILRRYNHSIQTTLQSIYPEFEWNPLLFQQKPPILWKHTENRRKCFDLISEQLGIQTQLDWYKVSGNELRKLRGGLFSQYGNSMLRALRSVYPEYDWNPLLFEEPPRETWSRTSNQRIIMDSIANKLDIQTPLQWLEIPQHVLKRMGASSLLRTYGGIQNTLEHVYPEYNWPAIHASEGQEKLEKTVRSVLPNVPVEVEHRVWSNSLKQHLELDLYIPQLSLALEYQGRQHYPSNGHFGSFAEQQHRDRVKKEICKELGITLVEIPYWWDGTKKSLIATIQRHRPDIREFITKSRQMDVDGVHSKELLWKLNRQVPNNFWSDTANQRLYMDHLASYLNFSSKDDWYKVSLPQLMRKGIPKIWSFFSQFDCSLSKALQSVYPEHKWQEWRFSSVPQNYWKKLYNRRKLFDWLADELQIETQLQWYEVSTKSLKDYGATGVITTYYNDSIIKALEDIYPECSWNVWLFRKVPSNFWDDMDNVTAYVKWLSAQIGIESNEGWYRVTWNEVTRLAGSSILVKFGSLYELLSAAIPNYDWNPNLLHDASSSKSHFHLVDIVQQLAESDQLVMQQRVS